MAGPGIGEETTWREQLDGSAAVTDKSCVHACARDASLLRPSSGRFGRLSRFRLLGNRRVRGIWFVDAQTHPRDQRGQFAHPAEQPMRRGRFELRRAVMAVVAAA